MVDFYEFMDVNVDEDYIEYEVFEDYDEDNFVFDPEEVEEGEDIE